MTGDDVDGRREPPRAMQAGGDAGLVGFAGDADRARSARQVSGALEPGRFSVTVDDVAVAGWTAVDLPRRYTETGSAGDPDLDRVAGQPTYDDLEMERGVRPDDTELWDWRKDLEEGRTDDARRTVTVSLEDAGGTARMTWEFTNARPTAYGPPTLEAGADATATESLTVRFEEMARVLEAGGPAARAVPLDSTVLRYVEAANGGRVDDGAMVVLPVDVGVSRLRLPWLDPTPTVDGSDASILVPAGVRDPGTTGPGVLWLLSAGNADLDGATGLPEPADDLYRVPAEAFFHHPRWQRGGSPGGGPSSDEGSIPGWQTPPDPDRRVLLHTAGHPLDDVFGSPDGDSGTPSSVEPVEPGETFDPTATHLAVVGGAGPPFTGSAVSTAGGGPGSVEALLDAGRPAPLAGATFGLATLSTPDASIGFRSVNPLVGMDTGELLQHEAAREGLRRAGISDADTVRWRVGPRPVEAATEDRTTNLLGTATAVESFEGVVSGDAGPWLVGVHVARVTDDDHVVAAGVHRHPLGTTGGMPDGAGWRQVLARSRPFTVTVGNRLEYLDSTGG